MSLELAQAQSQAPTKEPSAQEVEPPQQSNQQIQQQVKNGSSAAQPAGGGPPTGNPSGTPNPATPEQALRALLAQGTPDTQLEAIARLPNADVAPMIAQARTLNLLQPLFTGLSKGVALTANTRRAMKRVAEVGGLTVAELCQLFQIRFQKGAIREQTDWRPDILLAVWSQLDLLPDQDVTQNTVLTTFNAINGGGGTGPSWEAPATINTIRLGQGAAPAAMAHTVRHEVGHAVHAQLRGQVNPWLQGEMQFWFMDGNAAGIRRWLEAIDTWPENYTDATACKPFSDAEKGKVCDMLNSWMGQTAWGPTRTKPEDGQPDDVKAMWAACKDKMKNAVTQSTANWFNNHANFQEGSGGRTYFLNHYYHRPYHIGARGREVIRATNDPYTAMSEQEFFANAYAEYFKDPAGYTDRTKWGGNLPQATKDFFSRVVISRQPYQAPAPAPAAPAAGAPARPRAEGTNETAPGPGVTGLSKADATGAGMPT